MFCVLKFATHGVLFVINYCIGQIGACLLHYSLLFYTTCSFAADEFQPPAFRCKETYYFRLIFTAFYFVCEHCNYECCKEFEQVL